MVSLTSFIMLLIEQVHACGALNPGDRPGESPMSDLTVRLSSQLAVEIENPFGHDANDLPLERFCSTVEANCIDLLEIVQPVRGAVQPAHLEMNPP